MGGILVVELVEGRLPHTAVGVEEKRREGRVGEFRRPSLAIDDRAELHVGVGELPEDLRGGPGEGPLHGKQLLLALGEDVRTGADETLDADPIGRQDRQGDPGIERGGRDGEDLGAEEARLLRKRRGDMLEAAHHPLGLRRPLILAGPQMRVGAEAVPRSIDLDVVGEAGGEVIRRPAERAGEGHESGDRLLPSGQCCLPRAIGREKAGEIPGIPLGDLTSDLQGAVGPLGVYHREES